MVIVTVERNTGRVMPLIDPQNCKPYQTNRENRVFQKYRRYF